MIPTKAHRVLYDPRDGQLPEPPKPSGIARVVADLLVLTFGLVVLVWAVLGLAAELAT